MDANELTEALDSQVPDEACLIECGRRDRLQPTETSLLRFQGASGWKIGETCRWEPRLS